MPFESGVSIGFMEPGGKGVAQQDQQSKRWYFLTDDGREASAGLVHFHDGAAFDRHARHIYNKEQLLKPVSYYAEIRPTNYAREETARLEKEAAKEAARAKKAAAAEEEA